MRLSFISFAKIAVIVALAYSLFVPPELTVGYCTSPNTPAATLLAHNINASLQEAFTTTGATKVSLYFYDKKTGVTCAYLPHRKTKSASIVKVSILTALLWQRQKEHQWLSDEEQKWARDSIRLSDNTATASLWHVLGGRRALTSFYKTIGLNETNPGVKQYWGDTLITAYDQVKLMKVLTTSEALPENIQNYIIHLMQTVIPTQKWGIGAGASPNSLIVNKNGWKPCQTDQWCVHSIGNITNNAHDYQMALISNGSSRYSIGVEVIERVAIAINKNMMPNNQQL